MRAPKELDVLAPSSVIRDGKRTYSQISDDMLFAWESDVREGYYDGPQTIGQMIARIRESEADRDALLQVVSRVAQMGEVRHPQNAYADGIKAAVADVIEQVSGE
jgi:hypothetical protein